MTRLTPPKRKFSAIHAWVALGTAVFILALGSAFVVSSNIFETDTTSDAPRAKFVSGTARSAAVAAASPEPTPAATQAPAAQVPKSGVASAPATASAPVTAGSGTGSFELSCSGNIQADGTGLGSCTVDSRGGFTGTLTLSCANPEPEVVCTFKDPVLTISGRNGSMSMFTIAWDQAADGDHTLVFKAEGGGTSRTFKSFMTKGDVPKRAPEKRLPNGEPDYSDEPHITFTCDPPPGVYQMTQGESRTYTCTMGSYLGFSERVLVECLSNGMAINPECTPGSQEVTPPPNGSVQTVFTLTIPENYRPPTGLGEKTNVLIHAFRNNLYSDPGRQDYFFEIPLLP